MRKFILLLLLALFILTSCVDEDKNDNSTDDTSTNANELTPTDKPVIYLYPEEEIRVSVQLNYDGKLLCTYPEYDNGWNVTAYPDGKIVNNNDGLEYSYLFWVSA